MLTEAGAKVAAPKQRPYKLWDYDGLYLLVQPSGARMWRLKYHLDGKEKCISLGVYPKVSLSLARRHRDHVRGQLRAGIDPVQARRAKTRREQLNRQDLAISLSLSVAGELTVSNGRQFIHLSANQTSALRAFLLSQVPTPDQGGDHAAE